LGQLNKALEQDGCGLQGYISPREAQEDLMRGGKRQFGNQGGRTITTRMNHKEVILLFCLGEGQAGEVFVVV